MATLLASAFPAAKALHLIHLQPRSLTLPTRDASIGTAVELFELKSQARSISGAGGKGEIKSSPQRTLTASAVAPRVLVVSTRALKAAKAQKGHLKLRTRPGAVSEIRNMAIRALSPTRGQNLLLLLLFMSLKCGPTGIFRLFLHTQNLL
jgi:hypothetical protein